ncbi:MAG TPA: hypothetical protein VGD44_23840 [Phenylobacterium sp.]
MKNALIQIASAATVVAASAFSPPVGAPLAAASPGDDPMAALYGNTLTIAVPKAYYYARRYVDADGTWREARGSDWVRGAWERTPDGKTCHWQTDPPVHNPARYCYAPVRRQVGDEWVSTDPTTGNEVIQRIEPGRQ